MIAERILAEAVRALGLIDNRHCALDDYFDAQLQLPEARRTLTDLLMTVFRRRRQIDEFIQSRCAKAPHISLLRILEVAIAQIWFQDGIRPESAANVAVSYVKRTISRNASGFCNAVLREAGRAGVPQEGAESFPEVLASRWRERFSAEEMARLRECWLTAAPLTYRYCDGVADRLDATETPLALDWTSGWDFFQTTLPHSAWLNLHAGDLDAGRIYVQDPATALAVSMVKPSGAERVLDLCAAPGGKSLLIASLLNEKGALTSADRSEERLVRLKENLTRYGVMAKCLQADAANPPWKAESFEWILADVPCSNTGVFRRRPDALWRFGINELAEVVALQRRILVGAAPLVAAGGVLLYSTCSLEPEENALQVQNFLADHPEFSLEQERLLLPGLQHDGAYAAVLRRGPRHG